MYTRLSAILFPVTAILLIGALVWGYQENQEKNSILIKAENQYQRAFHDLSYHMDKLHAELGNILAVHSASTGSHRKSLVNVWRITSEAQNEINQLPLTLLPFNKTEEFLSRISKFSYQTAVRDLTKQPLNDNEIKNLKELYKSSALISQDLQGVQHKVIANRLRWMDVETALASEREPRDNTIIDGFKTVDKRVGEYPELDWGPSVSSMYNKRSVKKLGGNPVTIQEIQRKAADFTGMKDPSAIQVAETDAARNGLHTRRTFPEDATGKPGRSIYENGGHLISYNYNRPIGQKAVDMNTARTRADEFLASKGYSGLTPVSYDEYGNEGNFTYVSKDGDVLIYPEKVTLRVALDNGQVTGLQASDYVYERENRSAVKSPKLTLQQARKFLNPEYKETYHRLAQIENDQAEKVLTYEFGGAINGSNYRIYINADNGNEEIVEEVRKKKGAVQS
ncbi:germination protein YpeB [Paenibacillus macerans]|nr:germination protein YpeB [Paenibacillus macerans]